MEDSSDASARGDGGTSAYAGSGAAMFVCSAAVPPERRSRIPASWTVPDEDAQSGRKKKPKHNFMKSFTASEQQMAVGAEGENPRALVKKRTEVLLITQPGTSGIYGGNKKIKKHSHRGGSATLKQQVKYK